MKFLIDRDILVTGISTVEKFVPSKSPISILSGIKFFASKKGLYLSATDLDMGIEYKIEQIPEKVDIINEGTTVIGAKVLSEILRKIPKGPVSFSQEDNKININSGDFNMVLPCVDAFDFPEITRNDLTPALEFSQKKFKEMIKQTIFARAEDSTSRPQLTGVLLEYKNQVLNVVALDGFRIAWRLEEIDQELASEDFKLIVPGNTLSEISRIFSDEEDSTFKIDAGGNKVEFVTENIIISSRILNGAFIDYEKVVVTDSNTTINISTDAFQSAVERANILAREGNKNNLIKFEITPGIIEIQAETEIGSISDKLSCDTQGEDLVIAFNASFLIDALRTVASPDIELQFSGSQGPCIIRPQGTENHVNFILPVKLRSEEF